MDNFKKITNYLFTDIFGRENSYSLEELQQKFAIDIPIVRKAQCGLSKKDVWTFSSPEEKIVSQQAVTDRFGKDEWIFPKKPLTTMEEILHTWSEINYSTGEKYINSSDTSESDGVYTSSQVYRSISVFNSKNILYSYKIFDCDYMFASRDDESCTLGIRVKESIFCSSNFEVSWSNKVSKSMFIHDGFDLYECLFCSHIRSRKYCIANMQFEKEEYMHIKKMVIDWIFPEK